jgi:hypothetical protein
MTDQFTEAKAEEVGRHTPISYWCTLFDNCPYSPQDFYASVKRNLESRQVPDLLSDLILISEGTVFSKRRLYYQMRRERIVAEICAAPFGSGFFVSSRLFDRRRRAFFWDYVFALTTIALVTLPVLLRYGPTWAVFVFGAVMTTLWSVMRLATAIDFVSLDEKLAKVPWFGPIYETWFHPNTYFRQDLHSMYREAVNRSVKEAVAELTAEKGLRPPTDLEPHPVGTAPER